MRERYRKFARHTYRYLRNRKRQRENRFFAWLGKRVLNRELWKPDRRTIAVGLAIGIAVSMLPPIPVQMVLAAVAAIFLRANIPIAAAACWLSNPLTWAPLLAVQKTIGDWILPQSAFDELHPEYHIMRCIALGAVVLAVILAPLGYFVVYFLWDLLNKMLGITVPIAKKKIEPLVKPAVENQVTKKIGEVPPQGAKAKVAATRSEL